MHYMYGKVLFQVQPAKWQWLKYIMLGQERAKGHTRLKIVNMPFILHSFPTLTSCVRCISLSCAGQKNGMRVRERDSDRESDRQREKDRERVKRYVSLQIHSARVFSRRAVSSSRRSTNVHKHSCHSAHCIVSLSNLN